MAEPSPLGEFEQLVLLGVLHGGDDAYGVPVWREIERRTGRGASLAAVYKTLDRLEAKGLVRSHVGEPTAARGGRAKRRLPHHPGRACGRCAPRCRALARMADGLDEVLGT